MTRKGALLVIAALVALAACFVKVTFEDLGHGDHVWSVGVRVPWA